MPAQRCIVTEDNKSPGVMRSRAQKKLEFFHGSKSGRRSRGEGLCPPGMEAPGRVGRQCSITVESCGKLESQDEARMCLT